MNILLGFRRGLSIDLWRVDRLVRMEVISRGMWFWFCRDVGNREGGCIGSCLEVGCVWLGFVFICLFWVLCFLGLVFVYGFYGVRFFIEYVGLIGCLYWFVS